MRTYKKIQECGNSYGEAGGGISMTVPDQSMSIRTVIQRYAQGMPPPIGRELVYSEDMEDIRGLDISQLYELREQAKLDIEAVQQRMRQLEVEEQDKKRVEREKSLLALRDEMLKLQNQKDD